MAFENSDMMLQKEHAEHINSCQVDVNNQHASKFKRHFNLTAKLAFLTQKSWVTDLKGGYEIIKRGFKHGYGKYYVYVFRIGKVIVYDTLWLSQMGNMYILQLEAGLGREAGCYLSLPRLLEEQKVGVLLVTEFLYLFTHLFYGSVFIISGCSF